MDIRSLSNMALKEELLKHGVNPGPILPTTRGVYEKKLQQLLEMKVQENGDAHEDQYSDSDDEGAQFKGPVGFEVNCDGGDGAVFDNYIQTKVYTVDVPVPRRSSLPSGSTAHPSAGQYTHVPACIAAEFNQTLATLGDDFSVTKMLKQMERRSSLGQTSGKSNDGKNWALKKQEKITADKNTMTYRSPANTPKACVFMKLNRHQPEDAVSDDLSEMLSQSALGMSATRRKPIKGAAGRPIQFQYDDLVKRARMKEQAKETLDEKKSQRLVSVPLQITIFVLVAFIVLVFLSMESSPENPFEPPTKEETKFLKP